MEFQVKCSIFNVPILIQKTIVLTEKPGGLRLKTVGKL